MTSLIALSLGNSSGNVTGLVIDLVVVVVNFFAIAKIITKAGYSSKWILVPLTPVALWIVTFVLLVVEVRHVVAYGTTVSLPVNLSSYRILEVLDFLSIIVTWIFFLIFAFSDWPIGQVRHSPGGFTPGRTPFVPASQVPPGGMPRPGPQAGGGGNPGAAPAVAGGPSAVLVQEPPQSPPAVIYCSWCGKERAIDAQAIHHCGSKDRPAVFCMGCGTAYQEGAATCAQCGTPATQISK
jgi:hypothetical protein